MSNHTTCNSLCNFPKQSTPNSDELSKLKQWIREQTLSLGFSNCGFVNPHNPTFSEQLSHLQQRLTKGYHGEMYFLHENHDKRANPALLVEGTQIILSVCLNYLVQPPERKKIIDNDRPNNAIIARYARGRDYHKTMRGLLKTLAQRIEQHLIKHYPHLTDAFIFRPFADSAPIFEKAIAEQAGLGWTGKHTLLINQKSGSFFVLGELFLGLPLIADADEEKNNQQIPTINLEPNKITPVNRCGSCSACMDICPTNAIVSPNEIDARLCIPYLTIEHKGSIPIELRPKIGNRVFGCDDCQLICPWNKFAKMAVVDDFNPRHHLDNISLLEIWTWTENEFLKKTEGSPIRRTGFDNFMRNVAVALGNAPFNQTIIDKLQDKRPQLSENTQEHIDWAITQQWTKKPN